MGLTLLAPAALWALPAAGAALLLALLARREVRLRVPCLDPWRDRLALPRPRSALNPLDAETLCAALAPALAVLALAAPEFRAAASDKPLTVVVETSLSMRSRAPGQPSRLEQAAEAIRALDRPGRLVRLVTTDGGPVADPRTANEAAARLAACGLARRDRAAGFLAGALAAAGREDAETLWISDRPAPLASPRLRELRLGDPSNNLAITLAERTPRGIRLAVANAGDSPRSFRLALRGGAAPTSHPPADAPALTLPGRTVEVFDLPASDPAPALEIRITDSGPDDLPQDDLAVVPQGGWTAAIDRESMPRLALALETMLGAEIRPAAEPDCALAVSGAGPVPAADALLLVAPREPVAGLVALESEREAEDPRPEAGGLSAACLAGLGACRLRPAVLPPGARILATVRAGTDRLPLAAVWTHEGGPVALLAAAPDAWTGRPGFPLCIAELVERLRPPAPRPPGWEESDNRPSPPLAKPDLPPAGSGPAAPVPLSRPCAALAALAAGFVALRTWRRAGVRRDSRQPN